MWQMSKLVDVEKSYRNKLTLYHLQIKSNLIIISGLSQEKSQNFFYLIGLRIPVSTPVFTHIENNIIIQLHLPKNPQFDFIKVNIKSL